MGFVQKGLRINWEWTKVVKKVKSQLAPGVSQWR